MISKETIIYELYPKAAVIYTNGSSFDVKDEQGNTVTIDLSAVDEEFAKQEYKNKRKTNYPSIKEQLDMQYWDSVNGTTTWKDAITKVKTDNPKPR